MRGGTPAQNLGAPLGETRLHEATGQTTLIQVGAGGRSLRSDDNRLDRFGLGRTGLNRTGLIKRA
jgi:hypothetical protein